MRPVLFVHFSNRTDVKILEQQTFGWDRSWRWTDALTVLER